MRHPRPRSTQPVATDPGPASPASVRRTAADALLDDEDREPDDGDDNDDAQPRPPSLQVRHVRAKASLALASHLQHQEEQVNTVNQELDALAAMDLRAIARHALRDGISARLGSGQPSQTAVSHGAMLIAKALHRDGVQASQLLPLLGLWQQRIDSAELFEAAEQLLGKGFCRLDYPRGTPLADLCEVLFGQAQEVGDLYAAGGVVSSIHRKLELLEHRGRGFPPARPRRPFVRKYTAGGGDEVKTGARSKPS